MRFKLKTSGFCALFGAFMAFSVNAAEFKSNPCTHMVEAVLSAGKKVYVHLEFGDGELRREKSEFKTRFDVAKYTVENIERVVESFPSAPWPKQLSVILFYRESSYHAFLGSWQGVSVSHIARDPFFYFDKEASFAMTTHELGHALFLNVVAESNGWSLRSFEDYDRHPLRDAAYGSIDESGSKLFDSYIDEHNLMEVTNYSMPVQEMVADLLPTLIYRDRDYIRTIAEKSVISKDVALAAGLVGRGFVESEQVYAGHAKKHGVYFTLNKVKTHLADNYIEGAFKNKKRAEKLLIAVVNAGVRIVNEKKVSAEDYIREIDLEMVKPD